ncbi:Hypothetical predicted protein [Mytilus galloprovincialis]|uniref:Uncharacterized protein n=1 Tax=Mytilus galloprovincialis TaxID=29158 RepID=A0A8B6F898_MYTGA|nr:Hypothetical predicted protein [Mytilus galloprovincialis]
MSTVENAHPQLCICPIFPRLDADIVEYHGKCLTYGHEDGVCYVNCYNGYVGDSCELKTGTRECYNWNPCQNGGTCVDASKCFCRNGYTGRSCETNIDECASSPCQHGGVCHDGVNSLTCTCSTGYTGIHCESDTNECISNPCQHGGVCHDAFNNFTCTCTLGYTGSYCETVDACASNPCQNTGVCIDQNNGYTCTCAKGFVGIHCQYDINECHSFPCRNKGVCNDLINGYNCSCQPGYSGKHCQNEPTIKIAPKILMNEVKPIDEGTQLYYIPCFAEGIPQPEVKWESIDKPYLPTNSKQVADFLIFQNVTTNDTGLYMCTAKNEIGTDIKVVHIIVKAKLQKIHSAPIIHALSMVQVNYYGDARLVCNVKGYPSPAINWKYNNILLQSSGNIIVVHNVTNSTTGYYTCIATNDAGTSQANVLLKAKYDVPRIITPPKTTVIMTGHSHNFTCIATGHPPPSIKWSFKSFTKQSTALPSHQLHQQGRLLTLFSIKTHESGTLTCTAENEFGNDKASVAVVFRHPSTSGFG